MYRTKSKNMEMVRYNTPYLSISIFFKYPYLAAFNSSNLPIRTYYTKNILCFQKILKDF